MNNVQDKIGMGLSKIQDGLDKGKNKIDSMKEISRLNKIIEDVYEKKTDVLLEMGIMAYQKIREESLQDEDIKEKCKSIVGFDYIIYENKMNIEKIISENEGFLCECGNRLNFEDKFCGGCGIKVEVPVDSNDYISCNNCDIDIESNSNFCPCCGIKVIK